MKFFILKFKQPGFKEIIHLLSWAVFCLSIISFIWLGWFLYKNFYQTIASTKQIAEYKQEVSIEQINIDHVKKYLDYLTYKTDPENNITWSLIPNPFDTLALPTEENSETTTQAEQ